MSVPRVDEPVGGPSPLPPFGPGARLTAISILAAAAVLRLWHIDTGIPQAVGIDEPQIMNRVAAMMKTGDFNPHFFDWPSLTFYLNLVVSCLVFLGGAMKGLWSNLDQVSAPQLYLGARVFTAVLGTATVGLTMAAARRWGTAAALVAGALMAVVPGHVRESHYVLTDVPTAFFTTLTLLLSCRALERVTLTRLLCAAASAGLAASCKYNGSIAIIMPLIVVWGSGGGVTVVANRTMAVAGVGLAAFVAGTPYAILDLPKFLNDYARLASMFATRAVVESGWTIYPKHILGGIGWPALMAAIAGVGVALWRMAAGPHRARTAVLLAFAAMYFAVMAGSHQIYARYLLPLYPCLCLFCGLAVAAAADWLRGWRMSRWRIAVPAVLTLVLLVTPSTGAVGFVRDLGRPSTVGLAYDWFLANVPKGTKVAVEAGALILPDPYTTVAVTSFMGRSYDDYVADGVDYFLAASPGFQSSLTDPAGHRDAYIAYRAFFSRAQAAAAFDPGRDVKGPTLRIYRVGR